MLNDNKNYSELSRQMKALENIAKPAKSDLFTAEQLYNVYGGSADWKNYAGLPMPTYEELPANIKKHWTVVADFVNLNK